MTINWRSTGWIWLAEPFDSVRNRIKKLWGSKRKYHAVPINNPSYPSSLAKHVEGRVAAVFLLFYGVLWWILPTNFLVKKNVHTKVIIEIILNKGKYPDTAGFQCTFFITWWTTFKQIEQCFLFSYWNMKPAQKYVYIYCVIFCAQICCGLCRSSCLSCLLPWHNIPCWLPGSSSARAGGFNLQAAVGQSKWSCLPLLCFIRKQNIRFPLH